MIVALAAAIALTCTQAPTASPSAPAVNPAAQAATAPPAAPDPAATAAPDPAAQASPREYLALGDSGPFGTDPRVIAAGKGGDPSSFIGYPELLATMLSLRLTNAACPGETSGGFVSLQTPSGCTEYRRTLPLKVDYAGRSQLDFAVEHLRAHPSTELVTISIGGNDVGNLLTSCGGDAACIEQGYPGVLTTLRANLETIQTLLRTDGGYRGRIVAVLGTPIDFRSPGSVARTIAFNDVLAKVATAFPGGLVADVYSAFKLAAEPSLDQCGVGLRIQLPDRCDAHHSEKGRELIAVTIRDLLNRR